MMGERMQLFCPDQPFPNTLHKFILKSWLSGGGRCIPAALYPTVPGLCRPHKSTVSGSSATSHIRTGFHRPPQASRLLICLPRSLKQPEPRR